MGPYPLFCTFSDFPVLCLAVHAFCFRAFMGWSLADPVLWTLFLSPWTSGFWDLGLVGDYPCHFAHFPVSRFCAKRLRFLFCTRFGDGFRLVLCPGHPSSSLAAPWRSPCDIFSLWGLWYSLAEKSGSYTVVSSFRVKGTSTIRHLVLVFWVTVERFRRSRLLSSHIFLYLWTVFHPFCYAEYVSQYD